MEKLSMYTNAYGNIVVHTRHVTQRIRIFSKQGLLYFIKIFLLLC